MKPTIFIRFPLTKRRKLMQNQASDMASYYNTNTIMTVLQNPTPAFICGIKKHVYIY